MSWGARARTVQEGSLYALLFLLPFSKAAIELCFPVLLAAWLVERADPRTRAESVWARPSLHLMGLMLLGYVAACAISVSGSQFPALSLRGFVSKWLEYLLLFVVAADVGSRPGVAVRALGVLSASAVAVVIEAGTQSLFGKGLFRGYQYSVYGRATGPYENPGDLATYLMVAIPMLLAYALARARVPRRWLMALVLWLTVLMARTDAVGAWLGLGVGLAVLAWQYPAIRRYVVVTAVALVLGAGLVPRAKGQQGVLDNLRQAFTFEPGGSASDRWYMWQSAVLMIQDRPLFGQGLNTFMANYLNYWVGGERQPRYAHNCYLQIAAETGIVGLGFFLGVLACLFIRLARGVMSLPLRDCLLLVGMAGGTLAFAAHAAIDTNFYALRQAVLFWVCAGLAIGFAERLTAVPAR